MKEAARQPYTDGTAEYVAMYKRLAKIGYITPQKRVSRKMDYTKIKPKHTHPQIRL